MRALQQRTNDLILIHAHTHRPTLHASDQLSSGNLQSLVPEYQTSTLSTAVRAKRSSSRHHPSRRHIHRTWGEITDKSQEVPDHCTSPIAYEHAFAFKDGV